MILMKYPKVKGDCKIRGYKHWFSLESLSFTVGREVESKKGASQDRIVSKKGDVQEVSIDKTIDTATVDLMHRAIQDRTAEGASKELVEVEIHFVENRDIDGDDGKSHDIKPFLKVMLGKAIIKSWTLNGDSDGRPTESLTVACSQVAMVYRASEDGKSWLTYGPRGWDQDANTDWQPSSWKKSDRIQAGQRIP